MTREELISKLKKLESCQVHLGSSIFIQRFGECKNLDDFHGDYDTAYNYFLSPLDKALE